MEDVVSCRTLAEKHLKKFGSFLEQESRRLMSILDQEGEEEHNNVLSWTKTYGHTHHIWDPLTAPITLSWAPVEERSIGIEEIVGIPIPPEGNPDVQKVILVLTNLTSQLESLRNQGFTKFVTPILLYGDGYEQGEDGVSEGDGHIAMSKFIPVLFQLQTFFKVGKQAVCHWMEQMGSLFKGAKPHVVSITSLQLPSVFKGFGDFLAMFVVLDEVIRTQFVLQEHWTKYRQMLASVQADASTFAADGEQLSVLERELFVLEKEVVSGQLFKGLLHDATAHWRKTTSNGKGGVLHEKFQNYLTQVVPTIEKDFVEGNDGLKPLAVAGLFIFTSFIFNAVSDWKKFFQKFLQEPLKRIPAVPIGSSILWIPEVFINNFVIGNSVLYDSRMLQWSTANRQNYLQQKISSLPRDIFNATLAVGTWSVRLQSVFYSKALNQLQMDDLSKRCNLLLQGLKIALSLNQTFRIIMGLHAHLGRPVSKQVVCLLCQALELLKEVECIYQRHAVHAATSTIYIVQHVLHTALNSLKGVQKVLSTPEYKKMDELRADSLPALKILENSLRGPPSNNRMLVAKLTLDWALSNPKMWKGEDAALILPAAVERIGLLLKLEERIHDLCNGSELYWHRIILPTYLSAVYINDVDTEKLPLIFMVIGGCHRYLESRPHGKGARDAFVAEIRRYIKQSFTDKLCQDVETDVRLMAHSHLQVAEPDSVSPFRVGRKDHLYSTKCPTFPLEPNRALNLALLTEVYLSKTFYNLASVALHDWQSYAVMRVLASEKYGLHVVDDHLPGHSLEQGHDVLDLVRNLPKFVQEFTYNLNHQVFVQVTSGNKHLDTVNIRHLANSMRTHGIGMANTTVNAAYQFLRPKMHVFSQCLYEEQIRSRLAKDIRQFKQIKQDSTSSSQSTYFPFKAAEKFKKGIKKLGVQDGLTWLDKFRILITQIGNALGFVRLVRSGGLHYLAGGCRFTPDLEDIFNFSGCEYNDEEDHQRLRETISDPELTSLLQDATMGLDVSISKFFGGEHYFRLLVRAFSAGCTHERNSHLRNFYVIVPALTLSYVDYMRQCKEILTKKTKAGSIFTDDGFPMGIAYLLQVLRQDEEFDSLGWFDSVLQHFQEEKRREMYLVNEGKKDEKLEQASRLTAKRFQDHLQEFELLRFNLSSARIFFQPTDVGEN